MSDHCEYLPLQPVNWQEAEKIAGERIDRRRAWYATKNRKPVPDNEIGFGGQTLFVYQYWTESCTGCRETEDGHNVGHYPWDSKAGCYVGAGCEECGYTGKRRDGWPISLKDLKKENDH